METRPPEMSKKAWKNYRKRCNQKLLQAQSISSTPDLSHDSKKITIAFVSHGETESQVGASLANIVGRLRHATSEVDTFKEEMLRALKDATASLDKISKAPQDSNLLDGLLCSLRDCETTCRNAIDATSKDLGVICADLINVISELKDHDGSQQKLVNKLQAQLTTANWRIQALEMDMMGLKDENNDLRDRIQALEQKLKVDFDVLLKRDIVCRINDYFYWTTGLGIGLGDLHDEGVKSFPAVETTISLIDKHFKVPQHQPKLSPLKVCQYTANRLRFDGNSYAHPNDIYREMTVADIMNHLKHDDEKCLLRVLQGMVQKFHSQETFQMKNRSGKMEARFYTDYPLSPLPDHQ